ncbi:hypothetical protein [Kitasatospora brasiliensis]|uniref:hypothetical protein n=1 Tax=Kitasatospora brasiliensis TaxID=3058040 RepID=UPI00292D6FAC|nr:hypothetical protein [Kitasatospora sp. K002]
MKRTHARRLGGAAAATVAAGLLAVPTAAVADTAPAVLGVEQGGKACGPTTVPFWSGRTMDGPQLVAKVTGTGARFSVLDETTGAQDPVYTREAQSYGQQRVSVNVPGLVDGHRYSWHAWALQGTQLSDPSADCHFAVDTTGPTVALSSTDFPENGPAKKYAGQFGTFVLSGTDPAPPGGEASGTACFRVGFGMPGYSGCDASGAVKPGADGTAKVSLKVPYWGSNTLYFQAIDNAGNVTSGTYSFFAPSNPNPPKTLGDVDGDGVADLLLPDAQGNLQYISADASDTTPHTTIPAGASPDHNGWTSYRIAHRGWSPLHAPSADDLFVHQPGSGNLRLHRNFEFGAINQAMVSVDRSIDCVDETGADAECPADYAEDWSKADQIVALGPAAGGFDPALVTVEDGNLWLHSGGEFVFGQQKVRKLTASGGWGGYDLVAPGPDAAGNLALWARDRATGELHAYPVPKLADGTFDYSALADPSANVVATGLTVDAYPTLDSVGDADGDGLPDLWAVTADRHLLRYHGWSTPTDLGALR